jgi:hypothetical protein
MIHQSIKTILNKPFNFTGVSSVFAATKTQPTEIIYTIKHVDILIHKQQQQFTTTKLDQHTNLS